MPGCADCGSGNTATRTEHVRPGVTRSMEFCQDCGEVQVA